MATIGTIIQGKYEILTLIGKGGMSEVYLAMDKNLNKQWAIKEIKKKSRERNNEIVIQSAIAEANMMKKLDHPCLPRIVDIIEKEDVIYVVMDYIEGEPLSKIVERNGAQSQEVVIEWARDLCGVLDYLHTQVPPIIYRDMKPANIMLQPNGNIKLIDFGIAREYKESNLEDTISLGTKGYAAPEQFGGKGQTDARTDIYCLGVTLYHLVTGKNPCDPPYEIYPIRYWNTELSAGLENIILKCTQLNPNDRYESCAELMYAILHYEEADDAYRKKQKNKVFLFILLLCLSILFGVSGVTTRILKHKVNSNNYSAKINEAERAMGEEEKLRVYEEAIAIKPNDTTAYLGMIDVMKEDANFSVEEEQRFKSVVNPHLAELMEEEDYGELAYEIGKLYWYYYEYGRTEQNNDNQITRIKSATKWFEDVCRYGNQEQDYYVIAEIYRDIGLFNQNVTLNIEEASDKGTYAPYYNDLLDLVDIVEKEESEIVSLEVYRLCMYSIENYARKFIIDGVSEQALQELYVQIYEKTDSINATTDKIEQIKENVLGRAEAARQAIENASQGEK